MKKRFTEEKITGFLREAEAGLSVKDLCRRLGCKTPSKSRNKSFIRFIDYAASL